MQQQSKFNTLATVLPLLMLLGSESVAKDCPPKAALMTELGSRTQDGRVVKTDWEAALNYKDANNNRVRYFRHFILAPEPQSEKEWLLVYRDNKGRTVETISPDRFEGKSGAWSRRINNASTVVLHILPDNPATKMVAEVADIIKMPAESAAPYYSSKSADPDFVDLYSTKKASRLLGDHVGFVMVSQGKRSWSCSGLFVASDLVLTNWHCGIAAPDSNVSESVAWTQSICDNTLIDASWDDDEFDREFVCRSIVAKHKPLDFVLLKVTSLGRGKDRLRPALLRQTSLMKEPLEIIHHPAGRTKQHSFKGCQVLETERNAWVRDARTDGKFTEFTHNCDTEAGSSGAPVFDQNGRVVGLHHLGYEQLDNGDCDNHNKAVHIGEIIAELMTQAPKEANRLQLAD